MLVLTGVVVLTFMITHVNITRLKGRRSFSMSTAKRGSLETFKLFYEELKPRKATISRLRRARPGFATK